MSFSSSIISSSSTVPKSSPMSSSFIEPEIIEGDF
jgi:hypothetical protein